VPQVASAGAVRAAIARLYQIDPDRDGPMHIVQNADDTAYGHNALPPPVSGLDLNARANAGSNGYRAATTTNPNLTPVAAPVSRPGHTTSPGLQAIQTPGAPSSPSFNPLAGNYYPPSVPSPAAGMPAYPMYPTPGPYSVPTQPAMGPYPGPVPTGPVAADDASRREVVALKALVELLVQKGVISLDEYLARLKRS
jgi:hypothetical protein